MMYKLIMSIFIILLMGCSDSSEQPEDLKQSEKSSTTNTDDNAVNQQASIDKKSCPAEPKTGIRPSGVPNDDILGIREGMSLDDVKWVLSCHDDIKMVEVGGAWNIRQTYGFDIHQLVRASNGTECSGQEIAKDFSAVRKKCHDSGYRLKPVKDASHEVFVVFTGMPGEERVGGVWRHKIFAEGSKPAREAVVKSLTEKYGTPDTDTSGYLLWVWGTDNQRALSNSENFRTCQAYVNPNFHTSQAWQSHCGITIRVELLPDYNNKLLVREMRTVVINQKKLYDETKAFEAALASAHEQKNKQEVEQAGAVPDL